MTNLTTIQLSAGVPVSGTGNVSTLDNLMSFGISNVVLANSSATIGNVVIQSSANLVLASSTNMIGNVIVQSSANIGLDSGTNMIGNVIVQSSANVGLASGTNMIGNVIVQSSANVGIATGTNIIGSVYTQDTLRTTYRYAIANVTPTATPTDFLMIKGSATTTLHVKVIKIWGFSTAANSIYVQLVRRAAAYTTQGSAVFNTITAGKHDVNDASATANVSYISGGNFTANAAAVGGPLETAILNTGPNAQVPVVWNYTLNQDKALAVRGQSDFLFINFSGNTVPAGGALTITLEIEEDTL